MTPKVSVVSICYRPGYFDTMIAGLKSQTFKEFEWVVADDLLDIRKEAVANYIGGAFPFKHVKPKVVRDLSATASALNTALSFCTGELVYFMADYMYIHPRALQRHWYIYKRYGPKVIISGALIDAITVTGASIWTGHPPKIITVKVGDKNVTFPEHTPPLEWPMIYAERPTQENLISIWAVEFKPAWGEINGYGLDWRTGATANVKWEDGLYENVSGFQWFWAGRNDSGPLAVFKEVGGMDERLDGQHGGIEADMATRIKNLGYSYLIDTECPAYMLPHPFRKKETGKG